MLTIKRNGRILGLFNQGMDFVFDQCVFVCVCLSLCPITLKHSSSSHRAVIHLREETDRQSNVTLFKVILTLTTKTLLAYSGMITFIKSRLQVFFFHFNILPQKLFLLIFCEVYFIYHILHRAKMLLSNIPCNLIPRITSRMLSDMSASLSFASIHCREVNKNIFFKAELLPHKSSHAEKVIHSS